MKGKYDDCVIGLDPAECWVEDGCRYWSCELRRCNYAAIVEAKREKRRRVEESDRSDVMKRIRINPTRG